MGDQVDVDFAQHDFWKLIIEGLPNVIPKSVVEWRTMRTTYSHENSRGVRIYSH